MPFHESSGAKRGPRADPKELVPTEERRRIARQLYDSTALLLTSIEEQLHALLDSGDPRAATLVQRCESAIREIREELDGLGRGAPRV